MPTIRYHTGDDQSCFTLFIVATSVAYVNPAKGKNKQLWLFLRFAQNGEAVFIFYDMFLALCDSNGVTRTRACLDCGVSRTAWRKWKDGAVPNGETLNGIARYFGVTVDYLLGGTDESFLMATEYRLAEAERAYEAETDADRRDELALAIDTLRESLEDQRMAAALNNKKAPAKDGGREAITDDGYHIGILYDRADEKDRMLTHSVLDKYDDDANIISLASAINNPGGFKEIDVYDEPAAAGLGNYLDAPKCHREQFPSYLVPKGTDFGIKISGVSMEPVIKDKTTVFVKQAITIESGKVGVFLLDGAAYCKQLIIDRQKKEVRLHSFNPDFADIVVRAEDNLVTIGRVL